MNATQTPTCEKARKAIYLPCPLCGEAEASINLYLHGLEDPDAQFYCQACEGEFGENQIREIVRRWSKLLAWLDAAPDCE